MAGLTQPVPERLQAARLWAAHHRPYLGAALYAVTFVPHPDLGSMGVDEHWRLYYDPMLPQRVDWSTSEIGTVLIHEVYHLLREHAARARAIRAHPVPWNEAADAEINDDLQRDRLPLPGHPILPDTLGQKAGRLAEEYYRMSIPPSGMEGHAQRLPNENARPAPLSGRDGSGATGQPAWWEYPAPGKTTVHGLSPVEAELTRRRVAAAIQEHVRRYGTVPAGLQRWATNKLRPRQDWRRALAATVRTSLAYVSGASDYTYSRPARRRVPHVVLPALCRPVPHVAIVVDTSGSMDEMLLGQALAEVRGVLHAVGQRGVSVLAVDAAVHTCRHLFDIRQVELLGGGGTDMGAGLAHIEQLHPRPELAIVLTDGYTPWPERRPRGVHQVIVGLLDTPGARWPAPGWARVIQIG